MLVNCQVACGTTWLPRYLWNDRRSSHQQKIRAEVFRSFRSLMRGGGAGIDNPWFKHGLIQLSDEEQESLLVSQQDFSPNQVYSWCCEDSHEYMAYIVSYEAHIWSWTSRQSWTAMIGFSVQVETSNSDDLDDAGLNYPILTLIPTRELAWSPLGLPSHRPYPWLY